VTRSNLNRLKNLGYGSYREYLESDHWRALRARYRASRLPQRCLGCDSPHFQLHHRSYTRLGCELLEDLLPLCGDCHKRVHEFARAWGTQVQHTHYMLRKIFGWTKGQTASKFRPFTKPGRRRGFVWFPAKGQKPPGVR
jgi:hypothetical protein